MNPHEFGYRLGTSRRPRGVELWSRADKACRVIGPMGSGKTLRFFAPLIRHWPGPVLATSTKADTVETTLDARRRDQRPVLVLDPQDLAPALPKLRWSPITGAADTHVAFSRAKAAVAGTRTPGVVQEASEGAAFYKGQAAKVLACLLHAADLDGTRLPQLLRWARTLTDPAPLAILDGHPGAGPGWAAMLLSATTGDDRTVGNTRVTLDSVLECFAHQSVIEALDDGTHPTDIPGFLEAGGTIYLLGKDSATSTVAPLITAISEDLLDQAERHAATSPAGRLDPPLLAALDEAPNIAPIPSLRQRVADGRGRGMTVVYGLQSWASAEARFGPADARELAAYTNNVLVFGGSKDTDLLRELSELAGHIERGKTTTTRSGGPLSLDSVSHATTPVLEAVLRPDQIKALETEAGHALLLADNLAPVITELSGMWTWKTWPTIQTEIARLREANAAERDRRVHARRQQATAHAATWHAMRKSA
ncbi:conjugal transfer protein TraG [Streptomyces sp. AJS327]|uniref:type IV secretory system conjugative DNA transfer family protein n=1 Tax=Streptomyces sp. AJS327 TaxID=2545265 RepID=UPI0015DEC3B3|nr:TraM recognition domain-containing protein [Streptomyces sp. AJS327]MBA0053655.1 conjugal transfer protein TraG [Streptomyces sp. AJS327]